MSGCDKQARKSLRHCKHPEMTKARLVRAFSCRQAVAAMDQAAMLLRSFFIAAASI